MLRPMNVTESLSILALDDVGRPLLRIDGRTHWRDLVSQLLRLDSQWLVIEQRRNDGLPSPRQEDIRLSRSLSRRLRPMEMKLADHVIHGRNACFSFREAGLL